MTGDRTTKTLVRKGGNKKSETKYKKTTKKWDGEQKLSSATKNGSDVIIKDTPWQKQKWLHSVSARRVGGIQIRNKLEKQER